MGPTVSADEGWVVPPRTPRPGDAYPTSCGEGERKIEARILGSDRLPTGSDMGPDLDWNVLDPSPGGGRGISPRKKCYIVFVWRTNISATRFVDRTIMSIVIIINDVEPLISTTRFDNGRIRATACGRPNPEKTIP